MPHSTFYYTVCTVSCKYMQIYAGTVKNSSGAANSILSSAKELHMYKYTVCGYVHVFLCIIIKE